MSERPDAHRSSTVDNALSFLTLFFDQTSMGVSDAAKAIGISRTAAFTLAATMTERGFLLKNEQTKQYELGPELFRLASRRGDRNIIAVARPFMEELVEEQGESVYLSFRVHDKFLIAEGVESPHPLKWAVPLGTRVPLYVVGGRAHLAYLPKRDLERFLRTEKLEPMGVNIVTDSAVLRSLLEGVRTDGFVTGQDEGSAGVGFVAAPIWGQAVEPLAVVHIVLPTIRMPLERRGELIAAVRHCAARISRALTEQES